MFKTECVVTCEEWGPVHWVVPCSDLGVCGWYHTMRNGDLFFGWYHVVRTVYCVDVLERKETTPVHWGVP